MSTQAYLNAPSEQSNMIVHHTATCFNTLSAVSYCPHRTPESGKSSMLWCSVDLSSFVDLSFGPHQNVGGDELGGYHRHQDTYSITLYLVLCCALAGQLMQIPATAHLIPRTYVLSQHGLQLWDVDWMEFWNSSRISVCPSLPIPALTWIIHMMCKTLCQLPLHLTNLTRQKTKLRPLLWRRWTRVCRLIFLLYREECLSKCVVLFRIRILCSFTDKPWQKSLSPRWKYRWKHTRIVWAFNMPLSGHVAILGVSQPNRQYMIANF